MKKILLLAGALLPIGMTAFAQEKTVQEPLIKEKVAVTANTKTYTAVTELKPYIIGQSSVVSRTSEDGTYYTRPDGTMFTAFNEEGRGYYPIYLNMPAFKECTFVNKSSNPTASKWYLITTTGEFDCTDEYADASGNFKFTTDGMYAYPAPTLENGDVRFQIGEGNVYSEGSQSYYTRMQGTTAITPLSYFNDHDYDLNYIGWGILDTHYLFGSGTYANNGVTYQSIGVSQDYEKPASPLYVENVFIGTVSFSETPIPANTTITMTIVGTESNNTIATLTATADNFISLGSSSTTYGTAYTGTLSFSNMVTDPIFGVDVVEPFVIDEAFTVTITGLQQDGVNVGFRGVVNKVESGELDKAKVLLSNPATGDIRTTTYSSSPLAINVVFNGLFDGIYIWESLNDGENVYGDGNKLKISDDGTTCTQTNGTGLNGVVVETATPWSDEDGTEYYYFENLPDWITSVKVDDTYYEENGYYIVSFTANPLNGKDGEAAELYLKGRGITAEVPIIVTQGNGTTDIADDIIVNEKAKDNNIYNLNGQRVTKEAKGILIQNGKKYIKK